MKPALLVIAGPATRGPARRRCRDRVRVRAVDAVENRFPRTCQAARVLRVADRVYVYDNSVEGADARLCVRTQDGLLRKVYTDPPEWVRDAVGTLARHPQFVDARE